MVGNKKYFYFGEYFKCDKDVSLLVVVIKVVYVKCEKFVICIKVNL